MIQETVIKARINVSEEQLLILRIKTIIFPHSRHPHKKRRLTGKVYHKRRAMSKKEQIIEEFRAGKISKIQAEQMIRDVEKKEAMDKRTEKEEVKI